VVEVVEELEGAASHLLRVLGEAPSEALDLHLVGARRFRNCSSSGKCAVTEYEVHQALVLLLSKQNKLDKKEV